MKEMNDEELQELIDRSLNVPAEVMSPACEHDLDTYRLLFDELKKTPEDISGFSIAARVTTKLQKRKERSSEIILYICIFVTAITGILASWLYLVTLENESAQQLVLFIHKYRVVLLFGLACWGGIQYLDRKLVRKDAGVDNSLFLQKS